MGRALAPKNMSLGQVRSGLWMLGSGWIQALTLLKKSILSLDTALIFTPKKLLISRVVPIGQAWACIEPGYFSKCQAQALPINWGSSSLIMFKLLVCLLGGCRKQLNLSWDSAWWSLANILPRLRSINHMIGSIFRSKPLLLKVLVCMHLLKL